MHTFLLPFDGSESATRALEYLVRLHKEIGAFRVHLVNVQEEPIIYGEVSVFQKPEEVDQLKQEHGRTVLAPAEARLRSAGIEVSTAVVVGPVPETIVSEGERARCDHVVMGTRGMGALKNLLMGSVATKVLHHVKTPVTLVQ